MSTSASDVCFCSSTFNSASSADNVSLPSCSTRSLFVDRSSVEGPLHIASPHDVQIIHLDVSKPVRKHLRALTPDDITVILTCLQHASFLASSLLTQFSILNLDFSFESHRQTRDLDVIAARLRDFDVDLVDGTGRVYESAWATGKDE